MYSRKTPSELSIEDNREKAREILQDDYQTLDIDELRVFESFEDDFTGIELKINKNNEAVNIKGTGTSIVGATRGGIESCEEFYKYDLMMSLSGYEVSVIRASESDNSDLEGKVVTSQKNIRKTKLFAALSDLIGAPSGAPEGPVKDDAFVKAQFYFATNKEELVFTCCSRSVLRATLKAYFEALEYYMNMSKAYNKARNILFKLRQNDGRPDLIEKYEFYLTSFNSHIASATKINT